MRSMRKIPLAAALLFSAGLALLAADGAGCVSTDGCPEAGPPTVGAACIGTEVCRYENTTCGGEFQCIGGTWVLNSTPTPGCRESTGALGGTPNNTGGSGFGGSAPTGPGGGGAGGASAGGSHAGGSSAGGSNASGGSSAGGNASGGNNAGGHATGGSTSASTGAN